MSIQKSVFGKMPDGREVGLYTMTNHSGASVTMTNYGAIVTRV